MPVPRPMGGIGGRASITCCSRRNARQSLSRSGCRLGWPDGAGIGASIPLGFPGFLGDQDVAEEGMNGPTVEWMKEQAARHESAIAGSAVIVENGQHTGNRSGQVIRDFARG